MMRSLKSLTIGLLVLGSSLAAADSYREQRDQAERAARAAVGPSMNVTRRDNNGGPTSKAHGDGRAIDYTSNARTDAERDAEARRVSAGTARNVTTIVEKPIRHGAGSAMVGPTADQHDIYKSGRYVKTQFVAPRATGPHTHVQVDRCTGPCGKSVR